MTKYLIFGLAKHLSIKKPIQCYVNPNMRGVGASTLGLHGQGSSEAEAMDDLVDNIQKRFVTLIVNENLTRSEKRLLKEMKRYMRYHGHGVKSWRRDD